MLDLCIFSLLLLDISDHLTLFFLGRMNFCKEIALSRKGIVVDIKILLPLPKVVLIRSLLEPNHIV